MIPPNRPPWRKKAGDRFPAPGFPAEPIGKANFTAYQRYISGFSMVATLKNWLVPREALSASPATQAT